MTTETALTDLECSVTRKWLADLRAMQLSGIENPYELGLLTHPSPQVAAT